MRRPLLVTLLALCLTGIGVSNAQTHTLTCSAFVAPGIKCVYERALLSALRAEAGVGASVEAYEESGWAPRITPFFVLSFFGDALSWWAEVRVPSGLVNFMGDSPTAFSLGFSVRW